LLKNPKIHGSLAVLLFFRKLFLKVLKLLANATLTPRLIEASKRNALQLVDVRAIKADREVSPLLLAD
jgi:hypothetical protein